MEQDDGSVLSILFQLLPGCFYHPANTARIHSYLDAFAGAGVLQFILLLSLNWIIAI